jgi:site-specific DNA-methyltransferase (adenine-specific)
MTDLAQASFTLKAHNPDVLTCIANLSNDEVFTPPEFANQMLDTLAAAWAESNDGSNIWADSSVTFLDPFTKSGVFLREIVTRLVAGLADEIPDLQERVDHVLTKQVFGIGITSLTALLARRSVYCSKDAMGEHSVATSFTRDWGNIWFERTEHTWAGDRCVYCGASQTEYGRGDDLETHAYAFIHTSDVEARLARMFGADMHFDVIIGNPPYQLDDRGAGRSAAPIFHRFVQVAKSLEPRFLSMITPSRWMAGGKGLDDFRVEMLNDGRIRVLVDYIDSDEAFPGVDVAGGVSYFLWDRDHRGPCLATTVLRGSRSIPAQRQLDEFDVFVRYTTAVSILHKVWPNGHDVNRSLGAKVSGRNAFGFPTTARGEGASATVDAPLVLVSSGGEGYVSRAAVTNNPDWIDKWKATVSRAAPAGGRPDRDGRYYGLSSIRVVGPGYVTTEAYPVVGAFDVESEALHMCSFLRTRFARFLISLRAANQSVGRATFGFVPDLSMDHAWTDADLARKYGLTDDEIAFIEAMVRPMVPDNA